LSSGRSALAPLGVVVALMFVGLSFVVRTVQPVLEDMSRDMEEAAATLGAAHGQTFLKVTSCPRSGPRCSRALPWRSRAAWASTAR
jgi:ABC-type sulfate transport system permease component